jgi:DNA end-binding protein Ku
MPRAIWSGSINFGLVNVPVRMYSAIDEKDLHFHYLHVKDDSRIGFDKVCKKEGRSVPDEEIVKAYEIEKGEYVYVTDEDFEAAAGPAYRTIDIKDFVPADDIDPIYFERTYYLGPAEGAEKVYALLVRAMERAGLSAISTYVMREKQHLGCLRLRDGVITLEKMYFADEIRPPDDIKVKGVSVGQRELEMASELIDRFAGSFEIDKYTDEYREALLGVIRAKHRGQEVHVEPEREPEPTDLMEALRASVEAARREGASRRRGGRRNGSHNGRKRSMSQKNLGELESLTKEELGKRAKQAEIRGYSKMSKDELVEALRAAA